MSSSPLSEPRPGEATGTPRILGWSKTTLLDYPGRVASTLFLGGCNFRCPYCHNPELVLPDRARRIVPYDPEVVLAYLATYSKMIEGVCLTGGEPLLQEGLPDLCRRIRDLGMRIKVDTNGSSPHRLEALIRAGLVDYVAMDVKGPPSKLRSVAGTAMPEADLVAATETTIRLLRDSGLPHELRTTVVPGLLDAADLAAMAEWLEGSPRFVLQQFRPGKCLDPDLDEVAPYPAEFLRAQAEALSVYFPECRLRGLG